MTVLPACSLACSLRVPRVPYVFPACPCSPLYPLRGSTLPSLAWAREGEHGLR